MTHITDVVKVYFKEQVGGNAGTSIQQDHKTVPILCISITQIYINQTMKHLATDAKTPAGWQCL